MGGEERQRIVVKIVKAMAVFFIAGGLTFMWMGANHVKAAKATLSWPTVAGRVKESKMVTRSVSRNGPGYAASVVYEYSVEGHSFVGDRVEFDSNWKNNPKNILETLKKYSPGGAVNVHYNPQKPGESVLEPGAGSASWLFFIIGGAFLISGAIDYWLVPWLIGWAASRKQDVGLEV